MPDGSNISGICIVCGNPIIGRMAHSIYCSRKCLKKKANEKYSRSRGIKPRQPRKLRQIKPKKIKELYCAICGNVFFSNHPKAKYCSPEHALIEIKRRTAIKDKIKSDKKRKGIVRLPLTAIASVLICDNPELKDIVYSTGNSGNWFVQFTENEKSEYKMYARLADIFRNRFNAYKNSKTTTNSDWISKTWKGEVFYPINEENYELWKFFSHEKRLISEKYWNKEVQKENKDRYGHLRKKSMRDIASAAIKEFPLLLSLAS